MIRRRHRLGAALLSGLLAFGTVAAAPASGELVDVMVRPATTTQAVQADIVRVGGQVTATHDAVGLLVASVPSSAIALLEADTDVLAVMPDETVDFHAYDGPVEGTPTPLPVVHKTIGTERLRENPTGAGIDIALIDTGVADLPELAGRVEHALDLSFDAGNPEAANTDGFGHGTHLAGLMVGSAADLAGIAPGARLIDVRVGDARGVADVSQVIAAIDWVIKNARTQGRNIRVVNLAFGLPAVQDYRVDPLAYAVEAAWRNDIVVVVAAGNGGAAPGSLVNPATHPLVIAVGASTTNGTESRGDDDVVAFSQWGSSARGVDLVAPGRSLLSLMPADATVAQAHTEAWYDGRFLGSGTSQAAAVTSAAIALLLERHPWLNPDQVKRALTHSASGISGDVRQIGQGVLRLDDKLPDKLDTYQQAVASSDGSGSLEAARAGLHAELTLDDGSVVVLEGETDFTGSSWNGDAWAGSSWNGSSWNGSSWNGSSWNGSSWNGSSWNGSSWNGSSWNGSSWNGSSWNGSSWNGAGWNAALWGA